VIERTGGCLPEEVLMSVLFEPFWFSGIRIRNRFVRSATANNFTNEENRFTPAHWKLYTDLARGGVGLIMGGVHRPKHDWYLGYKFRQPCLDALGIEEELGALVDEVHRFGAAFVSQISPPFKIRGKQVGGSSVDTRVVVEPLDKEDIAEMRAAFRHVGRILRASNCDGVQLHCCHNDVLSYIISPLFNQRRDEYGGSPENRARLVLELVRELKEGAGEDFPVMIKMNASDFREDGMTVEDAAEMAAILACGGICAIEPSSGGIGSTHAPSGPIDKDQWHEGYLIEYAARIKKAVEVPVMVVGGMRDLSMMEEVIQGGKGDLISMCRPFIREPDLINRWLSGDSSPSRCTSCDGCLKETARGKKLRCVETTRSDGSPKAD
jgi:2,4-dienoyl-CoA reductase-like NADH-dependent reductase (Old Yellow Enzyme family)